MRPLRSTETVGTNHRALRWRGAAVLALTAMSLVSCASASDPPGVAHPAAAVTDPTLPEPAPVIDQSVPVPSLSTPESSAVETAAPEPSADTTTTIQDVRRPVPPGTTILAEFIEQTGLVFGMENGTNEADADAAVSKALSYPSTFLDGTGVGGECPTHILYWSNLQLEFANDRLYALTVRTPANSLEYRFATNRGAVVGMPIAAALELHRDDELLTNADGVIDTVVSIEAGYRSELGLDQRTGTADTLSIVVARTNCD